MEEYILVRRTSDDYYFKKDVIEKIKEGYVCQGSPLIVDGKWIQAMVLAK